MILFRADGNRDIGSGHVMRCLSIADQAKVLGEQCVFLMASDDLQEIVVSHGHQVSIFYSDYANMMSDLVLTEKWIKNTHPLVLVVDSYYASGKYLYSLKQCCVKFGVTLIYIDDLLAFPYPCDILINYNIYGLSRKDEYYRMYQETGVPKFLLGLDYVPLRSEFQHIGVREVKKNTGNILVSTGGADFGHVSLALMKKIVSCTKELQGLHFHFIVGTMNKDVEAINKIAENSPLITVHSNVQAMSKLMQSCDLAISAAGSTLYELCATQTPTVTYILADNQILGAEDFEHCGIMKCVGDLRQLGIDRLVDLLIKESVALGNNYEERRRIAKQQGRMVDGKGAERIIKNIVYH